MVREGEVLVVDEAKRRRSGIVKLIEVRMKRENSMGFVGSFVGTKQIGCTTSEICGRSVELSSGKKMAVRRGRGGRVEMNLFSRFFRVLRANANKAVTDMEDPEKILKQSLEEMQRDLEKVSRVN